MSTTPASYRAYDTTTGWMGRPRTTSEDAAIDAVRHNAGCAKQGGYGRAIVVERDGDRCMDMQGAAVWPPHGRSSGAVRWAITRPAHRPRQDPTAARVSRGFRVRPSTLAMIDSEAKRTGESAGQVIDRLAARLARK